MATLSAHLSEELDRMETTAQTMNRIASEAFANSKDKGFHDDDATAPLAFALARVALIGTELSEFVEEVRKPEWSEDAMAEELADAVIRIGDLAASMGLDLGNALVNKMEKNRSRPKMHGKRI